MYSSPSKEIFFEYISEKGESESLLKSHNQNKPSSSDTSEISSSITFSSQPQDQQKLDKQTDLLYFKNSLEKQKVSLNSLILSSMDPKLSPEEIKISGQKIEGSCAEILKLQKELQILNPRITLEDSLSFNVEFMRFLMAEINKIDGLEAKFDVGFLLNLIDVW